MGIRYLYHLDYRVFVFKVVIFILREQYKEGDIMPDRRQISPKAASAAGKVLSDPTSTKAEKTAAASALSQTKKK